MMTRMSEVELRQLEELLFRWITEGQGPSADAGAMTLLGVVRRKLGWMKRVPRD